MSQLLDEILSSENMKLAYKKVKANKGASGVDGISTDEVSSYLKEHWLEIKERKKIEAQEEELKILKFNRDKALKEEELLRERKRIQEQREIS